MRRYGFMDREAGRTLTGGGTLGVIEDWREHAACRLLPVEEADRIFFPSRPALTRSAYRDAADVCAKCPVINRCLESALVEEPTAEATHGFRAGLDAAQRKELLRMPDMAAVA